MKNIIRIAAIGSMLALVIMIMAGCGQKQTAATETKAEAATETKAETAAETKAEAATETKAETAAETKTETAAETEEAAKEVTYESKDGWKMNYFPNLFDVKEEADGKVNFIYKGKSSGEDVISISYHKGKLPSEVLYEKVADIPDERVSRSEGWFGSTYPAWTFSRSVAPGKDEPKVHQDYTGIEHNGGTLLINIAYHQEDDDDLNMDKSDQISGTIDTLELVNHQPQQEMAYKVGTYDREYKEEIEGEEYNFTDTITLNEDHTGVMSFQDDIEIIWTSYELIDRNNDLRYEYDVEGDTLLVNMNDGGEWLQFERRK